MNICKNIINQLFLLQKLPKKYKFDKKSTSLDTKKCKSNKKYKLDKKVQVEIKMNKTWLLLISNCYFVEFQITFISV